MKRKGLQRDDSALLRTQRSDRLQWRVTLAGAIVLGIFMLATSLAGAVATWRVAMVFQAGGEVVQWRDGPDLVVMAAPLLAAALYVALPATLKARPVLSCALSALFAVLIGIGLGRGDALVLEHVAAVNGYHYCPANNVWDLHGNRGGGPALRSWGYSRLRCPAQETAPD